MQGGKFGDLEISFQTAYLVYLQSLEENIALADLENAISQFCNFNFSKCLKKAVVNEYNTSDVNSAIVATSINKLISSGQLIFWIAMHLTRNGKSTPELHGFVVTLVGVDAFQHYLSANPCLPVPTALKSSAGDILFFALTFPTLNIYCVLPDKVANLSNVLKNNLYPQYGADSPNTTPASRLTERLSNYLWECTIFTLRLITNEKVVDGNKAIENAPVLYSEPNQINSSQTNEDRTASPVRSFGLPSREHVVVDASPQGSPSLPSFIEETLSCVFARSGEAAGCPYDVRKDPLWTFQCFEKAVSTSDCSGGLEEYLHQAYTKLLFNFTAATAQAVMKEYVGRSFNEQTEPTSHAATTAPSECQPPSEMLPEPMRTIIASKPQPKKKKKVIVKNVVKKATFNVATTAPSEYSHIPPENGILEWHLPTERLPEPVCTLIESRPQPKKNIIIKKVVKKHTFDAVTTAPRENTQVLPVSEALECHPPSERLPEPAGSQLAKKVIVKRVKKKPGSLLKRALNQATELSRQLSNDKSSSGSRNQKLVEGKPPPSNVTENYSLIGSVVRDTPTTCAFMSLTIPAEWCINRNQTENSMEEDIANTNDSENILPSSNELTFHPETIQVPPEMFTDTSSTDSASTSMESAYSTMNSASTALDSAPTTMDNASTTTDSVSTGMDSAATAPTAPTTMDIVPTSMDSAPTTMDSAPTTMDSAPTTMDSVSTSMDSAPTTMDSVPTSMDSALTALDSAPTTMDNASTTTDSVSTGMDSAATAIGSGLLEKVEEKKDVDEDIAEVIDVKIVRKRKVLKRKSNVQMVDVACQTDVLVIDLDED